MTPEKIAAFLTKLSTAPLSDFRAILNEAVQMGVREHAVAAALQVSLQEVARWREKKDCPEELRKPLFTAIEALLTK